ncbi:unnamed protein product [Closterium sp. NIES-54]
MVHQVLQRFGFTYSSPQSTPLPTGYSLSAPPSDESVEPSGPYLELVGCLKYLMICTRPDLAYPLSLLARYVAPGRHQKDGLELSSLVTLTPPGCEAEIYAGAMAAQELCWLTYLLTDLGEAPCSPPVLPLVAAVEAAVGVAAVEAVGLLREWLFQRGTSGGSDSCPYVIRTGDRASQTCGKPHTQHHCFSRLDNAWRAKFGDEVERPRWADLLSSGVAIIYLDFDVILSDMYALSASAKGGFYRCVPADPGIVAAALGASESVLPSTAPDAALHSLTLDSGTSRCFFRDSTTLTPLPAPIPVRLDDPSGGTVIARSSTILPCPKVPSGSLSGLHLLSFSTNLVSTVRIKQE